MARLSLRAIEKSYGAERVLSGISLEAGDGEFLVLVGPSGCGKSTLLRIVAGLVGADVGEVWLDGERVDDRGPAQRDVAMVFQNYALYPHKTVERNISFPLEMARVPRPERERRVRETAALLGLETLLGKKPATLSGGQMQRVALGRAIVRNPRLFLFDEPLSNLDAKLRDEMRGEIRRLHERLAITTLYVTHDQAEAMTMGSRICVLDRGRIQQIGSPLEVFARPATSFVASFLGSPGMNLLRGHCEQGEFRAAELRVPCPAGDGERLLGIRPHEVELGPGIGLEVVGVEELGTRALLELDAGGCRLLVSREGASRARCGERIEVFLPPDKIHWFDGRSGVRL